MSRVKQKTPSGPPSQEPLEGGSDSALPFISNTVAPLPASALIDHHAPPNAAAIVGDSPRSWTLVRGACRYFTQKLNCLCVNACRTCGF